MEPLPLGLITSLEAGTCVLFVGAGVGEHFLSGHDGKAVPDGQELATRLCAEFSLGLSSGDLAKVAAIVERRKNRSELEAYLRKYLGSVEPDAIFQWITSVRWEAIFTTNYDNAIERAYEKAESPFQLPKPICLSPDFVSYDPRTDVPVFHIHGALFGNNQSIVITKRDYVRFREHRRMLFDKLKEHFAKSTFLYLGYSNNDPNWSLVLDELAQDFYPSQLPQSYRIAPTTDDIDVEILSDQHVTTIKSDFQTFVANATYALKDSVVEPDQLGKLQRGIPLDLQPAFAKNPAAVLRLLNSWEYVNQAAFDEPSNIREFLKGNRPNWSVIEKRQYFARDVEEKIFDDLLDYATITATKPRAALVATNAGFGMTTLLRTLAVGLVREKIRPVLFHKPGAAMVEGDIEFAAGLFSSAPFFIIDDAQSCTRAISKCLEAVSNLNRPAYFLMGSRRNEWPAQAFKQSKTPFTLDSLSDLEIEKLLDFLKQNNALNKLEGLDKSIQFSEIKSRNSKDLLVTMRSATEGIDFDAIIESEYRGIPNEVARQAYLAVCSVYQYGAYLRDAVIAKIIDVEYADLYAALGSAADGVIVFDLIDEALGLYAGRARHRVIAQVVWERASDRSTKDSVLQKCIQNLNITYRPDAITFEQLVRSDRLVDDLSTLEGKIKFFDTASQKDPDNQYVQQHYARMLFRAGKLDLALPKIEQGISYNEQACPRPLFHTKAVILTEMMIRAESDEIARRRMLQAEKVLQGNLRTNPKDHYSVHSLAKLYFEWAKRVESDEESAEYLKKAEEEIGKGLRSQRERESLWILSAEINSWLGNDPKRLSLLRRAVSENSDSVIGRFLLARALRENGSPAEAKDVLQPVLAGNPDEFRAYLEYALSLYGLNEINEAINILELSTLYGHADCRYLATHGGLLFLAGHYPRAQTVFEAYRRKDFDDDALRTPYFKPLAEDGSGALKVSGRIVSMLPGYCFIESTPRPKFICPSSKYGGVALRSGDMVSVQVVFTARGPVGYFPEKI